MLKKKGIELNRIKDTFRPVNEDRMSFMTSLVLIFNVAEIWRRNDETSFLLTVFLFSSQEITWANTLPVGQRNEIHTSFLLIPTKNTFLK